ncbi:MAG: PDZ domain-containing protein [Firmicutes bacterium]|nr:PDZ domain-containing protein [Bacillota bacterium]
MINKIYDKIIQTIKENYKIIVFFVLAMFVFTIELPYYIEAPGGVINIDERIEIEEKTYSSGTLNLAYVSQIKATLPTLIYAKFNKDWDILKKSKVLYNNETELDEAYRSHLLLKEANNNAVIVAYKAANKKIELYNEHLYIIYVSETANTDLKIGDEILEVENTRITSKDQIDDIVLSHDIGDKIQLVVKRDNKEIECFGILKEVEGKKIIGVSLSKTSDIITEPKISFKFKSSESGPSGGFMMALSIYDALVEEDITGGKKIVGTGTIDVNGNIGSIGGIEYKIKGAVKENADIFLVPFGENYEEAKRIVEKNGYNLELIEVKNFQDALNKLKTFT